MEEEVPWASGRYDTVTLSFQLLTNSCPHLPWVYQRLQRVESVFNTVCLLSAYRVSRITLDLEAQCWAGQVWISPLGATSSAGPGTHTDGHRARGGGACQSPVVLSTGQPEAPGLNPRVVFLRRGWRHPVKVVHARAAWLRLAGSASQGWWHWKSCGMKDAPSRRREQWLCGV